MASKLFCERRNRPLASIITSVAFERLSGPQGPTGGKLLRPSNGNEAKDVAFIQWAGSRDRNYVREKYVDEAFTTQEKKVQCCGGALAFSEPEKSQAMIKAKKTRRDCVQVIQS